MFWKLREDRAARVGAWKWVALPRGGGLFNLEEDIGEQYDLTLERPEVACMVREKSDA